MAYDGRVLARVRDMIAETRRNNEIELERRRAEVFARIPAIGEIESEMTRLMTGVASDALKKGKDAGAAVGNAKSSCEMLLRRRGELLMSGGYPPDYIDDLYCCPKCHDTGYVLGKPCDCLKALYKSETVRGLSSLLNTDGQRFETFDLGYYDDVYDPVLKASPKAIMSTAFNICREYAAKFGEGSQNLLFRGGTGLGKTFLSACIARVVSENGFSVVYDTAVSVLEAFEMQKFDRSGVNAEEVSSRVRRYLECDLLILDDLGTEMSTNFTISAIYTIINSRLLNGVKTIITTNLGADEISRRYSPQISSRLSGEYSVCIFAGKDIREIKREHGPT